MEGEARATVSLYDTGKRIKGREGIRSQPRERKSSYSTGSCEGVRIVSTIPWIYDGHRANPFVSSASAQHANAAFFLYPPAHVRRGRCSTVPPFHQSKIKVDRPLKSEGTRLQGNRVDFYRRGSVSFRGSLIRGRDRTAQLRSRAFSTRIKFETNSLLLLNGHRSNQSLQKILLLFTSNFSPNYFYIFYNSSWGDSDFIKRKNPRRYNIRSHSSQLIFPYFS